MQKRIPACSTLENSKEVSGTLHNQNLESIAQNKFNQISDFEAFFDNDVLDCSQYLFIAKYPEFIENLCNGNANIKILDNVLKKFKTLPKVIYNKKLLQTQLNEIQNICFQLLLGEEDIINRAQQFTLKDLNKTIQLRRKYTSIEKNYLQQANDWNKKCGINCRKIGVNAN